MSDKPEIVLSSKVNKIINWMTEHVDTEVAALGRCDLKNGNLFVKELVFPNQEVTAGSVKFGGTDWKSVIKEVGSKNLGELLFHWHKHPAGSTPSKVDEDDTFGAFMDGSRPLFGFLITGMLGNRIDYDARIMINKPVKADIEAEVTTEEDTEIEEYCKKILDEKVKKEVEVVEPTNLATAKCIIPYAIENKGIISVVFGTIFKKAIREELQEIGSRIASQKYSEKDGVGIYSLTASGKTKKLRKAVNDIVDEYETDDYQTDIKTFEAKDVDHLKYFN